MNEHGSRNCILITLAVLALWTALSDHHKNPERHASSRWISLVTYPENRPRHRMFGDLAEFVNHFQVSWTGRGKTEELAAGAVAPNFFQMIGVEPVLGRAFVDAESGSDHVVMLSYRFWQRHYHGSAAAVKRTITLDGAAYRVIGILPGDFTWNDRETDVWMPCRVTGESVMDFEI